LGALPAPYPLEDCMTAEMWRDIHTHDERNVEFGRLLQQWLRSHDIAAPSGVIIVTLEAQGYSLLSLGPTSLSRDEMLRYLNWVVHTSLIAEDRT
jgi:hypothetical protein